MKNSKTCLKCSGTEIYSNMGDHNKGDRCSLPVSTWTGIGVIVYCCTDCGYLEEYMDKSNAATLDKLKSNWKKV